MSEKYDEMSPEDFKDAINQMIDLGIDPDAVLARCYQVIASLRAIPLTPFEDLTDVRNIPINNLSHGKYGDLLLRWNLQLTMQCKPHTKRGC
jgi:hypothetical protein